MHLQPSSLPVDSCKQLPGFAWCVFLQETAVSLKRASMALFSHLHLHTSPRLQPVPDYPGAHVMKAPKLCHVPCRMGVSTPRQPPLVCHISSPEHLLSSSALQSLFFTPLLGPHSWHMGVPRLGVESELQLPAYITAAATPGPSHVFDLHHSSWHCQIHNPLNEAWG